MPPAGRHPETDLMMVASPVTRETDDPGADAHTLWSHEHVTEAMMADHTVLPMRFGTVVPDEAVYRRAFSRLRDFLHANLARVEGCAEFGVRLAFARKEKGTAPPTNNGTAYIRARLHAHRRPVGADRGAGTGDMPVARPLPLCRCKHDLAR
ncbi:MAG: hypothetical protein FD153_823 [Rhodospirillaceae bacterium]|nr:MAG: hypothetical protein FD153_823 [Rhodospirillaceae bacterium]